MDAFRIRDFDGVEIFEKGQITQFVTWPKPRMTTQNQKTNKEKRKFFESYLELLIALQKKIKKFEKAEKVEIPGFNMIEIWYVFRGES